MTKTIDTIIRPEIPPEIIEDSDNPAYKQVGQTRKRIFLSLTAREAQEYEATKPWIDRQLWINKQIEKVLNFK